MSFDRILKIVRTDNGLTQEELAEVLGVSRTHVNRLENKKAVPTKQFKRMLSILYNYRMDWLDGNLQDKDRWINTKLS